MSTISTAPPLPSALDLIDAAITDLEAKLNLPPGGNVLVNTKATESADSKTAATTTTTTTTTKGNHDNNDNKKQGKKKDKQQQQQAKGAGSKKKNAPKNAPANINQPDICKLEFKVGVISKVWVHPEADKLYCEEIDCGEDQPRQIASGLRLHYDEVTMLGQRLLVVSNLKPKNLVGFKSFGMVLCAATTTTTEGEKEKVEFIEPPEGAKIGETITFEGLPTPEPFSGAQVEKKKVFAACMEGMKTSEDCVATWNGHAFLTSAGPCKSKTIKGGPMR